MTILGGIAAIWYFADRWWASTKSGSPVDQNNSTPEISTLETFPLKPAEATTHENLNVHPEVSKDSSSSQEAFSQSRITSPGSVESPESPHISEPEIALPLEAVLEALNDPGATKLQKSHFKERHEGLFVTWIGKVCSVSKLWETEKDSEIQVLLIPPKAEYFSLNEFVSVTRSAILHRRVLRI
ncbi:hypothetical protein IH970_03825 [candidate division KSB1 bacterium]|nr:hypothetical protein [candidate division KSB1 bacterium]